ncbi:unnamed protein product [Schistosoma rodhaini]|uniref:Uncharacterized protein n=1 Tax=Schistosoma rodhaini TaxID=6188 RepID=A0AA85EZ79_9TREM|nr:unnamed protein product [Schistosoma rodhaini]
MVNFYGSLILGRSFISVPDGYLNFPFTISRIVFHSISLPLFSFAVSSSASSTFRSYSYNLLFTRINYVNTVFMPIIISRIL